MRDNMWQHQLLQGFFGHLVFCSLGPEDFFVLKREPFIFCNVSWALVFFIGYAMTLDSDVFVLLLFLGLEKY